MKVLFVSAWLFLIAAPLAGQILNVEESRLRGDSANQFYGNFDFVFQLHNRSATPEEEVRYTGLSIASRFGYLSQKHNYMLISDLENNSVTGEPFIRTGYSHFRSNFFRTRPLSYEGFAQVQFDVGRGMNFRWLAGAGLRVRITESEKFKLFFGPGLMFEEERWETPGEADALVVKKLVKSTNYLSLYYQVNKLTDFNFIVYYQTGRDGEADIFRNRFSLDAGLGFKLSDNLLFKVDFAWAYETDPVVPIVHYVYALENGISINF